MKTYPTEKYVKEQIAHTKEQIKQLRDEIAFADNDRFIEIVYELHDLGRLLEGFKELRGSGGTNQEVER